MTFFTADYLVLIDDDDDEPKEEPQRRGPRGPDRGPSRDSGSDPFKHIKEIRAISNELEGVPIDPEDNTLLLSRLEKGE